MDVIYQIHYPGEIAESLFSIGLLLALFFIPYRYLKNQNWSKRNAILLCALQPFFSFLFVIVLFNSYRWVYFYQYSQGDFQQAVGALSISRTNSTTTYQLAFPIVVKRGGICSAPSSLSFYLDSADKPDKARGNVRKIYKGERASVHYLGNANDACIVKIERLN